MRSVLSLLAVLCILLAVAHPIAADTKPGMRMQKAPSPPIAMKATAGALDCSGAIEIVPNNTYYGSNVGAPNNVEAYDCVPYYWESGGEVVYHLFLEEPTIIEVSISAIDCDLDLAVLNACDEVAGCVDLVDNAWASTDPISGDWYFVVEGYFGAECDFSLTITGTTPPPPPPTPCETAPALACQNVEFEGTTCGGENFISSLACAVMGPHEGLEDWFAITLVSGGSFTATVAPDQTDAALFVLDGCEPVNCLAYADQAGWVEPETITYTNATGSTKTVYLVIDSYMAGTCGSYLAAFTCNGGEVATEESSWGAIKSLYR